MTAFINQQRRLSPTPCRVACVIALFCAALLVAPTMPAADELHDATSRLALSRENLENLRQQRQTLEREYRKQVQSIDRLKSGSDGIVNQIEVRAALRTARTTADQLNLMAEQERFLLAQLDDQRHHIIALFDESIRRHETALLQATSTSDQAAIIAELNTIQLEKERYRAAVPATDRQTPRLDTIIFSDPEELNAAIDELTDHQKAIRKQLLLIDAQITDLERKRKLARFVDDYADEIALFGEDLRATRLTTSTRTASPDAQKSPAQEPSLSPGGNSPDGAENPNYFDGIGRGEGSELAPLLPPSETPPATPPPTYDPTTTPPTPFQIQNADPSLAIGRATPESPTGNADDLQALRQRRARLQQSLGELDAQQRRLLEQTPQLPP